tara:strand:+ start:344 stop:616 length:273 start_codon:yes stop_codon:yes gene_type:complete
MKTFQYFDKKIGGDMWSMVNEYLQNDNTQTKKDLMTDLKKYFYENQYDEERYPHFRMCDMDFEHDENGEKQFYFVFYEWYGDDGYYQGCC